MSLHTNPRHPERAANAARGEGGRLKSRLRKYATQYAAGQRTAAEYRAEWERLVPLIRGHGLELPPVTPPPPAAAAPEHWSPSASPSAPEPSGRGAAAPAHVRAPGARGPLPGQGGAPVRADTSLLGVRITRDARALLDALPPAKKKALGSWVSAAITEKAARDAGENPEAEDLLERSGPYAD